jgi:hypothetical protein
MRAETDNVGTLMRRHESSRIIGDETAAIDHASSGVFRGFYPIVQTHVRRDDRSIFLGI